MVMRADLVTSFCASIPFGGFTLFRLYSKLMSIFRPRRIVQTFFGSKMHCDSRDLIQRCISFFGVWEPEVTAEIQAILRPGDLFVDIGANIGFFTLFAASLVGENGSVIAIEASPSIAESLRTNIALNDIRNVRVANVAASDVAGQLDIFSGPSSNSGLTTTLQSRGLTRSGSVPALPLDQILTVDELSRVRFIKIDIEGGERALLVHMLKNMDRYPHRLCILVEASVQESEADWRLIFQALQKQGFTVRPVLNKYSLEWYLRWKGPTAQAPIFELPTRQTDLLFVRG
jgi:FkbM family methyltransferase